MPLHDFRCSDMHVTEQVVTHGVEFIECGSCRKIAVKVFLAPAMVAGDLQGYTSPVDGRWVEGKRARREDLRRNDCVAWEPGMREENARKRQDRETKLDRAVEETVEAQIHAMPARKREHLVSELEAGVSAHITRSTPT